MVSQKQQQQQQTGKHKVIRYFETPKWQQNQKQHWFGNEKKQRKANLKKN